MISERSANRGSCAQSCRKDYVLNDTADGAELDRGYLISAKDLGAYDHLQAIADAGVGCLKIEGRKKKPEYVATVTKAYREFLDRVERGHVRTAEFRGDPAARADLLARGYRRHVRGREGRDYVTRTHPDNHGLDLGVVTASDDHDVTVEVRAPVHAGDGLGFEPMDGAAPEDTIGFAVLMCEPSAKGRPARPAIASRTKIPIGWRVVRTLDRN